MLRLLEVPGVSQRVLGDVLGLDHSGVNRRLLMEDDASAKKRMLEWRAWEVFVIAQEFGIPLDDFFVG